MKRIDSFKLFVESSNFNVMSEDDKVFFKNLELLNITNLSIFLLQRFCESNGILEYGCEEHRKWFVELSNKRIKELEYQKKLIDDLLAYKKDWVFYPDQSIAYTDKLGPKLLYVVKTDTSSDIKYFEIQKCIDQDSYPHVEGSIGIYEYEDGWFKVELRTRTIKHSNDYKCDQIEEVLDLLKYLITLL